MRIQFLITLLLLAAPSLGLGRTSFTNLPTHALMELARASMTRPLTPAEVQQVLSNEIATFVFLESKFAAFVDGSPLSLPSTKPSGCLVEPIYDILRAADDGSVSDAEMSEVATRYEAMAYIAYTIVTNGGEHPAIISFLESKPGWVKLLRQHVVVRYIKAKLVEPSTLDEKIDYYLRHFLIRNELAVVRFLELNTPAADRLIERMQQSTIPPSQDVGLTLVHNQQLLTTVYLLSGLGDPRLHDEHLVPMQKAALVGPFLTQRLRKLRALSHPNPGMSKAAVFWRETCGKR